MTASTWSHIKNFHLPYLREFQRLGWETHTGCPDAPEDAPFVDRALRLPFEKSMTSAKNLAAARIIRKAAKKERYDLIITHTSLASFFTRLAVKGLGVPLVNVVHGYLFGEKTPFIKRAILITAEKLTAKETSLLLTMNAFDNAAARRHRLSERIEEIPGVGVDFSRFDAISEDKRELRRRLGVPEEAFLIVCAAEFSSRKNQRVLIEAMKYLPERAVLALCGSGAKREECRRLAESLLPGESVLFPGHVGSVPEWYAAADAAAAASRTEGLPFSVMEAMRSGLPVAASAVKGHLDLIEDNVSGLLYPCGDSRECAAGLRALMEDEKLCRRLGEAARLSTEKYSLEKVLPEVMEKYLSAVR